MRIATGPAPAPLAAAALDALTLTDSASSVEVRGRDFTVAIDKGTGLLRSLVFKGKELLASPLGPHFWRAPVDNDRGNDMPKVSGVWRQAHRSLAVHAIRADRPSPGIVRVTVDAALDAVKASLGLVYTVYGTGEIVVEASLDSGGARLPELPRFGMQARLVPGFEQMTWYGPGPEESYSDRKDLRVGVHRATVASRYFEYSQPQETGATTDARWVALTNDTGAGLLATGMPLLSVVASHYATEDLDSANHRFELTRLPNVVLNLDLAQRGLGGDDSWGALPHSEFRLDDGAYRHRFRLRLYDTSTEAPMALSKVTLP